MIIVECFVDEFLIKELGFSPKKIRHEGGKGKVLEKVRKNRGAVGVVDEDPGSSQPGEMKKYVVKETTKTIKLLVRNDDEQKHVIQISPYLEHWLLKRAKTNKISPKDFSLPDDAKALHGIPHVEKDRNFQGFVRKLIQNDEEMKTLKKWIEEVR